MTTTILFEIDWRIEKYSENKPDETYTYIVDLDKEEIFDYHDELDESADSMALVNIRPINQMAYEERDAVGYNDIFYDEAKKQLILLIKKLNKPANLFDKECMFGEIIACFKLTTYKTYTDCGTEYDAETEFVGFLDYNCYINKK